MATCTNCAAAAAQQQQLPCELEIDYSQVLTDPILPFTIRLNLATSILEPAPGQNQRFCYQVEGIGEDTSEYADLSHIVFGICSQIPLDLLENITVVRNGVPEEVIIGDNVELRTEGNPDPPTGCLGLKFDFGLDKVNGVMDICFELTTHLQWGQSLYACSAAERQPQGFPSAGLSAAHKTNALPPGIRRWTFVCL